MKTSAQFLIISGLITFQVSSFAESRAGSYGYEYEHKVPADYIYRTEKTLEPPAVEGDAFNPVSTVRRQREQMKQPGKQENKQSARIQMEGEEILADAVKILANQLLDSAGEEVMQEYVLAVSTFVNLNHLYKTSALGRFLSEQLLGELQRAGVEIIDVRKAPGLMISEGHGEYILSRDMDELSYVHQADAVVAGTYSMVENKLYINVRLLKNDDGLVLASGHHESPIGNDIMQLLADESMPAPVGREIRIRELEE